VKDVSVKAIGKTRIRSGGTGKRAKRKEKHLMEQPVE
jgi:hypothetical protein